MIIETTNILDIFISFILRKHHEKTIQFSFRTRTWSSKFALTQTAWALTCFKIRMTHYYALIELALFF